MKVRSVVAKKKALASLVQVGWWLKQLSGSVQKHLPTDQQRLKKKKKAVIEKKLSFIMISLANTSSCLDYMGNKKVFYYMPWYS